MESDEKKQEHFCGRKGCCDIVEFEIRYYNGDMGGYICRGCLSELKGFLKCADDLLTMSDLKKFIITFMDSEPGSYLYGKPIDILYEWTSAIKTRRVS